MTFLAGPWEEKRGVEASIEPPEPLGQKTHYTKPKEGQLERDLLMAPSVQGELEDELTLHYGFS